MGVTLAPTLAGRTGWEQTVANPPGRRALSTQCHPAPRRLVPASTAADPRAEPGHWAAGPEARAHPIRGVLSVRRSRARAPPVRRGHPREEPGGDVAPGRRAPGPGTCARGGPGVNLVADDKGRPRLASSTVKAVN